jgi:hypothetical protein
VQREAFPIENYQVLNSIELLLLVTTFLFSYSAFNFVACLVFLEKLFYYSWFVLELGVSYQLFYIAISALHFFIIFCLRYELGESVYFIPKKNKLCIEHKSLKITLRLGAENTTVIVYIVNVSENYIVIYSPQFKAENKEKINCSFFLCGDEVDLTGQVVWSRDGYVCIEVNSLEDLKSNNWGILYGKIQRLGIF